MNLAMPCEGVLLAWWFLVVVPGFQGLPQLTVVGPFAVEAQCEKYHVWVNMHMPHEYLSDCWNEESA